MFLCFRATSVPRQSSRPESRQSCMTVTNMNIRRLSLLPRECWMRPECAIINTIAPVKQSRFLCKMQEKGGILCDERG